MFTMRKYECNDNRLDKFLKNPAAMQWVDSSESGHTYYILYIGRIRLQPNQYYTQNVLLM